MSIIRFSTEEVFSTDSSEYEILTHAIKSIKGVSGAVVEIGTRRGGSTKLIIDSLVENNDTDRLLVAIDPYGNIEIECTNRNISVHMPHIKVEGDPMSTDISMPLRFDYTDDMRNRVIPSLYYYAYMRGINFQFFCLEDTEFFNAFPNGVPVYQNFKTMENTYAFVFFDGPHDNKAVNVELEFFTPRATIGSVFVFDDIWMYEHDNIVEKTWLYPNGFELLEKGNIKASYVKRR